MRLGLILRLERVLLTCLLGCLFAIAPGSLAATPTSGPVHGLWVWKSAELLAAPQAVEKLRDFCRAQGINEVYVSYSAASASAEESKFAQLIELLHRSNIRLEALLSSTDADEAGKYRNNLLDHVRAVVAFNGRHASDRFDGIHLDIEPQQRPENKGTGNLRYLPGLADAFRAVDAIAQSAGMTVNADIQTKLLKGDAGQRQTLLDCIPRVTLMMYELSSPGDGQTPEQKAKKVTDASAKYLAMAYADLNASGLAKIVIALRTPDYGDLLPQMLATLDDDNRANPHYLGWARHSYNDVLNGAK
jgi:hypothetical protein